eukprot:gene5534-9356_t
MSVKKKSLLEGFFQSGLHDDSMEDVIIHQQKKIKCPKCHNSSSKKNCFSCIGEGFIDNKFKSCFLCFGKGVNSDKSNCNICEGYGFVSKSWSICETCHGKQKIEKKKCQSCSGGGYVEKIL